MLKTKTLASLAVTDSETTVMKSMKLPSFQLAKEEVKVVHRVAPAV